MSDFTPEKASEKSIGNYSDPRDKDGDGIGDDAERKAAPGLKYDSMREAYRSRDGFLAGLGEVIRNTTAGRNTFGRAFGLLLDIVTVVFPQGSKIDQLRRRAKDLLNLTNDNDMKDIITRVFTTANGGFWRLWDELEGRDWKYYVALILRAALIFGVLYAADYFGLPVDQIFTAIQGL